MSEWTKGPWFTSMDHACETLVRAGDPKTGMRVATTFASHADQANPETRLARIRINEANARLIAASPVMADYIQRKANEGDAEAVHIMEAVNASRA